MSEHVPAASPPPAAQPPDPPPPDPRQRLHDLAGLLIRRVDPRLLREYLLLRRRLRR